MFARFARTEITWLKMLGIAIAEVVAVFSYKVCSFFGHKNEHLFLIGLYSHSWLCQVRWLTKAILVFGAVSKNKSINGHLTLRRFKI